MIEETLVAILDQFAPTHPLVLPGPEPALPAIVYQRISGVDDHSHDGPGRVRARYQVSFWGSTFGDALALYEDADAFLDGYSDPEVTILAQGTYDDEDDSTRGNRPLGNSRRIADYVVSYRKARAEDSSIVVPPAPALPDGAFALWDPTDPDGLIPTGLADLSGNGRNATQAAGGFRPTTAGSINGLQALRYDGVDDSLNTAAGIILPQPYTVLGAFQSAVATGAGLAIFDIGGGGANIGLSTSFGTWAGQGLDFGVPGDDVPHRFVAVYDGADSRIYFDGAQITGDPGTGGSSGGGIYLGSYEQAQAFWNGDIGQIGVYDWAFDNAEALNALEVLERWTD